MSWLSRRAARVAKEQDDFFFSLFFSSPARKKKKKEKHQRNGKVSFRPCFTANDDSSLANPSGFLIGFCFALLLGVSRSACVACLGRTPWCARSKKKKKECRSVAVRGDFFPREEPKVGKL